MIGRKVDDKNSVNEILKNGEHHQKLSKTYKPLSMKVSCEKWHGEQAIEHLKARL